MTRDEIAQAMQDTAGYEWGNEAHFQRFAKLLLDTEREACAQIVEPSANHRRDPEWYIGGEEAVELLIELAAAIRARSKT